MEKSDKKVLDNISSKIKALCDKKEEYLGISKILPNEIIEQYRKSIYANFRKEMDSLKEEPGYEEALKLLGIDLSEGEKKDLLKEHGYQRVRSNVRYAPWGEWYMFVDIWDNKIVGFGNEQGYQATAKNKEKLIGRYNKVKKLYEEHETNERISDRKYEEIGLYEKIKDIEIADEFPEILEDKGY